MTEYFDSIAKRIASILLTLAVSFALFACADIGERDNPVDPGYKGNASSVKYGSLTDSRDGQVYKTVTIGTQTWMAENLNYKTSSSYCYEDNAGNCSKYGRLYEWSAAMDACPTGWHLPNDEEWNTLWDAVGGTGTAGTKLKSSSGWNSGGNGTDSFGFAVLPAGYRYYDGYFSNEGYGAYFWSSTEDDSSHASNWYFYYDGDYVYDRWTYKDYAFSVRCLRDSDEGSGASSSSSQAKPSSSSSSVILSESEGSSSSKAVWAYLNPNIDYGEFTDDRDNQIYKTVTIGTQTWMAENLNYDYNEGTAKSYCYGDNTANCDKYGRLYLWSAAMDSAAVFSTAGKGCGYGEICSLSGTVRGVCPEGWHLPSNTEWNTLWSAVGGTSTAGTKLKSTSGWYDNGNGTDSFGFAVLPAGDRGNDGNFSGEGNYAYFWRSTENDSYDAGNWYFNYYHEGVYRSWYGKNDAFSVRCLRDSDEGSGASSSSSQAKPSSSSSSVNPGTDPESSSSSAKSSSSIASSSSVVSSSSVASSSSMKAAWTYLNPSISYGEIVDSRDGQVYKTVTIGTQTWMAENLNYDPGDVSCMGSYAWSGCYNNESANCSKYGRLYSWEVAMNDASCAYGNSCNPSGIVRGVCPAGWHLPTKEEWQQLVKPMAYSVEDYTTYWYYNGAGVELKTVDGWSYYSSSTAGTNASGFSALPAGRRNYNGNFRDADSYAYFWSASENADFGAYYLYLYRSYDKARLDIYDKGYSFSVRCVQNSN